MRTLLYWLSKGIYCIRLECVHLHMCVLHVRTSYHLPWSRSWPRTRAQAHMKLSIRSLYSLRIWSVARNKKLATHYWYWHRILIWFTTLPLVRCRMNSPIVSWDASLRSSLRWKQSCSLCWSLTMSGRYWVARRVGSYFNVVIVYVGKLLSTIAM